MKTFSGTRHLSSHECLMRAVQRWTFAATYIKKIYFLVKVKLFALFKRAWRFGAPRIGLDFG